MGTESIESERRGLSSQEALVLTRLAAEGETIVTLADLQESDDLSYERAKGLAHNLVRKKWLDRLKPGLYLIVPLAAGETGEYTEHEFVVASHLADPTYVSYWSALNYHGLTEQVPLTVFAATTEQVPEREIHGVTYRFVTLTPEKFFGSEPVDVGGHQVDVATVEKTLADCADHPEHCGGITELAKALRNAADVDYDTLAEHLLRLGNGAAIKRVVYLADRLGVELSGRDELVAAFTTGYSKLDPTRGDDGRYSGEYRLLLNVDEEELLEAGGRSTSTDLP